MGNSISEKDSELPSAEDSEEIESPGRVPIARKLSWRSHAIMKPGERPILKVTYTRNRKYVRMPNFPKCVTRLLR